MKTCKAIISLVVLASAAPASHGEAAWEKPCTALRYLHPPMVDCMYTLWKDGKVMRSDNRYTHDWKITIKDLPEDVLWFMHGADDKPFDFKTAENRIPPDGAPFHGLTWRIGDLAVDVDAFCQTGVRSPACLVRLTVTNLGNAPLEEPFAAFLRRMELSDADIMKECYSPYETRLEPFMQAKGGDVNAEEPYVWRSEVATVRAEGLPAGAKWDDKSGAFRFAAALAPGASIKVIFTIARHDSSVRPCDWECEYAKAQAFWRGELAKLNRLPPAIRTDGEKLRIVQNLVVQMLQCFCFAPGSDLVIPRQGGLSLQVWPWESMYVLDALGRIGDFGSYVEGALDMFFREYGDNSDGEIGPFFKRWACDTASCLQSLARYCLETDNAAVWRRHRDAAMRAFGWIRAKRAETADGEKGYKGLFPAMRATDDSTKASIWGMTDNVNLAALRALAAAAQRFGDSMADEVQAEADDLRDVMAGIYLKFSDAAKDKDELRIPLTPEGDDDALIKGRHLNNLQGRILSTGLECGYIPKEDVMKVYTWHLRNGKASPRGLCANVPRRDSLTNTHYWYTTSSDIAWHDSFLRIGRRDLAAKVMDATIHCATSEELYTGERYRDDEPWYFPWCPNASGGARIILMMLKEAALAK